MASMEYNNRQRWHSSPRLQYTLEDIHQTHGRARDTIPTLVHTHFTTQLLPRLHKNLNQAATPSILRPGRLEYTSRLCEGLAVSASPLEYNVLVIAQGGEHLDRDPLSPDRPGLVKLRAKPGFESFFWSIRNPRTGFLNPLQAQNLFRGYMYDVLHSSDFMDFKVHLSKEEDLKFEVSDGNLDYYVSVVLGYEVEDVAGRHVVLARGLRDEVQPGVEDMYGRREKAWTLSFTVEEKQILRMIDVLDNGCRKRCARLFKVFCHNHQLLRPIPSYLIKTKLLHMNKNHPSQTGFWSYIGPCLMAFISEMADSLGSKTMDHFFIPSSPSINLLVNSSERWTGEAGALLNRLVENEVLFYTLVDALREQPHTPTGLHGNPCLSSQSMSGSSQSFGSEEDDEVSLEEEVKEKKQEKKQKKKDALLGLTAGMGSVAIGAGLLALGAHVITRSLSSKNEKVTEKAEKEKLTHEKVQESHISESSTTEFG